MPQRLIGLFLAAAVLAACSGESATESAGSPASSDTTTTAPQPTTTTASTTSTTSVQQRGELGNGETITLAFGGDSSFTGLDAALRSDPARLLAPIAPTLSGADRAMVNLEAALTEGGTPSAKQLNFRVPPQALESLAAAGVDAVSVANNHGMDYGPAGFEDTIAVRATSADTYGVTVLGAGAEQDDAYSPLIADVSGQRLGVIAATDVLDGSLMAAWTAGPDKPGLASSKGGREQRLIDEVTRTRPEVDTLVVYLHMGRETETCPNARQVELTRALHAAGADIVVGTHAHRLQGAGYTEAGDFTAYGLGNYIFGTSSAAGRQSGTLLVDVTGQRIDDWRWEPARITNSVPIPLEGRGADLEAASFAALADCAGLTVTPPEAA